MPGATRPRYTRDIESQEAGQGLGWHTHDFGQFFSAIHGSMYVSTRDRVLLLNPAMAVWIPPDVDTGSAMYRTMRSSMSTLTAQRRTGSEQRLVSFG